jgi:hypothetical protein
MHYTEEHDSWLFISVISIRQTLERKPTDVRILFTNYDIIVYFLDLASCSEHFIRIKHRILATFNMKKKSILTACMSLR